MWRCGGPVRSSLILPFRTSVCDVILGVVPALEASFKMTLATFAETLPWGNRVEGTMAGEISEGASQTATAVCARVGHWGPDEAGSRCTAMRISERRRPAHVLWRVRWVRREETKETEVDNLGKSGCVWGNSVGLPQRLVLFHPPTDARVVRRHGIRRMLAVDGASHVVGNLGIVSAHLICPSLMIFHFFLCSNQAMLQDQWRRPPEDGRR